MDCNCFANGLRLKRSSLRYTQYHFHAFHIIGTHPEVKRKLNPTPLPVFTASNFVGV